MNKPCEYCGAGLPFGVNKRTRRVRSAHFSSCPQRPKREQPWNATVDPFADLRDKRMGELSAEQTDRATELWLREQIGPRETYWYPHLQTLFRIIDRLRAENAALREVAKDPHAEHWAALVGATEAVAASENATPQQCADLCQALDRLSEAIMGEEIARLRAENAALREDGKRLQENWDGCANTCSALHAENAALRKDAELLAWVLAHPETAAECLEDAAAGDGTARVNLESRSKALAGRIDAAMARRAE